MFPHMLLVAALTLPFSGEEPSLPSLAEYRWNNRLLLTFAPHAEDKRYLEQRSLLAQAEDADLAERDLLVFTLFAEGGFVEGFTLPANKQRFDRVEAEALRKRLGVSANDFQIILIGKDGGEKRRSRVPVSLEALLTQIDSMPMRQREMKDPAE